MASPVFWTLAAVLDAEHLPTLAFWALAVGGVLGYVGVFLGARANRRLDAIARAQEAEIAMRLDYPSSGGHAKPPTANDG